MGKIIDLIFKDIKKDKNIYVSLVLVILISLVFGMFFITILSSSDKTLLTTHINTYLDSISNQNSLNLFNNILNNNIIVIILWVLGFSILGIPFIILLLFYKSFCLSFTVASIIYTFKIDGILLSFIYIFPHLILNLLFYFIVSYYSFKLCIALINKILNKKNMHLYSMKKYIVVLVISLLFLSFSALYETFILPYLIKIIY